MFLVSIGPCQSAVRSEWTSDLSNFLQFVFEFSTKTSCLVTKFQSINQWKLTLSGMYRAGNLNSITSWKNRGVPLEIAQKEFGGAENLEQAIAGGRAFVLSDEGEEFYSWKEIDCGKKTGWKSQFSAKGQVANTQKAFEQFSTFASELQWGFVPRRPMWSHWLTAQCRQRFSKS